MRIAVIGTGIAGVTFAEEIRKSAPDIEITLLTRESNGYYSRPLLSHGFTRPDIETRIVLKSFPALAQTGIRVESGAEVLALDRASQSLRYVQNGAEHTLGYDRLVFATGSAALIPPPFRGQAERFQVLNSLADLIALRRCRAQVLANAPQARWAVVGGGLVGCEIAADLSKAGDAVELFHALPRLMERQLAESDSEILLRVLRADLGVAVHLDQAVQGFAGGPGDWAVVTGEGERGGFHGIIVACGFQARVDLAREAGLKTQRGICVDGFLATADPNIHAIGDCAELPDGKLYAYVTPVRHQAQWLAKHLLAATDTPWAPPLFKPKAKVPGFEAAQPYLF
jgi:NAD(P)H-nitrite reductase large subunit